MARNPNPYTCDECGTSKTPSNNWFLLVTATGAITIMPWNDPSAEDDRIKHLCGISCALKMAGKELAKVYGTEP